MIAPRSMILARCAATCAATIQDGGKQMFNFEDWRKRRAYAKAAQAYQQPMSWDAPAAQPAGYGVLAPENLPTEGQHPGYGVLQQGMLTDTNATKAAAGQTTDWGAMLGMMAGAAGGGGEEAPAFPHVQIDRSNNYTPDLLYHKYFNGRVAEPAAPLRRRRRRGLLDSGGN